MAEMTGTSHSHDENTGMSVRINDATAQDEILHTAEETATEATIIPTAVLAIAILQGSVATTETDAIPKSAIMILPEDMTEIALAGPPLSPDIGMKKFNHLALHLSDLVLQETEAENHPGSVRENEMTGATAPAASPATAVDMRVTLQKIAQPRRTEMAVPWRMNRDSAACPRGVKIQRTTHETDKS